MIRELLEKLKPQQRNQLIYAHQNELSQYIILPNGHFIGVHLDGVTHLQIEETHNDWYAGKTKNQPINFDGLINNQFVNF